MYLNRDQQEQVILMTVGMGVMELLADQEKFLTAKGDLKRAVGFAKRALDQIRQSVDEEAFLRLRSVADRSEFILKPRSSPKKSEVIVELEQLRDLQSFAIHNHCRDCKVDNYKTCRLRALLTETNCPAANEARNECQYKQ